MEGLDMTTVFGAIQFCSQGATSCSEVGESEPRKSLNAQWQQRFTLRAFLSQ